MVGGLLDSFNGIYENIVKDYVTDVYTDVIEGYSIATIKVKINFEHTFTFYFDLQLVNNTCVTAVWLVLRWLNAPVEGHCS